MGTMADNGSVEWEATVNLEAIEKANRDKGVADKIVEIVEDWLGDEMYIHEFSWDCNLGDVTVKRWNELQSRIERLLGEEQ
jgi:hypothetical protein